VDVRVRASDDRPGVQLSIDTEDALTIRESTSDMVIVVNGKPVRLSAADSAQRKRLLREAAKATVAMYRPALERLEKA